MGRKAQEVTFLSIQAQDFIEDGLLLGFGIVNVKFLSIQAQDFIEDSNPRRSRRPWRNS